MTETAQHPESDSIDWDDYEHAALGRVWAHTSTTERHRQQAVDEAVEIVDAFAPDEVQAILVNCGPYRGYDVAYRWKDTENRILHLDYYSVRPGFGKVEDIISEVAESLEELND